MFAIVQALAVSISVAIAFGLHLPNADWMPIATLVAMKVSLDESVLRPSNVSPERSSVPLWRPWCF
jgi:hypothetical protein